MVSEAPSARPVLSDAVAMRVVDGALGEAQSMGVPVTITLVDDGGHLKTMRRMDGAALVSIQTAQNKAYAAVAIGMPVDDFFAAIKEDAAAVASFASRPGLALIGGGVPLLAARVVIGGLGVAGAMTAAEDRKIAEAGARQAAP